MADKSFISMFRRGIKVNVIGDSIAAGAGASDSTKSNEIIITTKKNTYCRRYGSKSWYGLFEEYIKDKFPKCSIVNNGCGGITSSEVREYIGELYSDDDDLIILQIGGNDRKIENGMNILFDNLTYIVRYLKEKNKKIILMTGLPSTVQNESFPNRLYHNEETLIS